MSARAFAVIAACPVARRTVPVDEQQIRVYRRMLAMSAFNSFVEEDFARFTAFERYLDESREHSLSVRKALFKVP